jgi:hypothetical protein
VNGPVTAAGHDQLVPVRQIGQPLWLTQSGDALRGAVVEVDRVHRTVAQFGHEHPMTGNVSCEMVDAAYDTFESDGPLNDEWRWTSRHLGLTARRKRQ